MGGAREEGNQYPGFWGLSPLQSMRSELPPSSVAGARGAQGKEGEAEDLAPRLCHCDLEPVTSPLCAWAASICKRALGDELRSFYPNQWPERVWGGTNLVLAHA